MSDRTLGNIVGFTTLLIGGALLICGVVMVRAQPEAHHLAEMTDAHWIAVSTIAAGCIGFFASVVVIR